MKNIGLLFSVIVFGSSVAFADANSLCYSRTKDLYVQVVYQTLMRMNASTVPVIVKAAAEAGVSVDPSSVILLDGGPNLMGVGISERIVINGVNHDFYADAIGDNQLRIIKASDDAEYDSLGNIVKPATQTICVGELTYITEFNITNADTNQAIGSGSIQSDDPNSNGLSYIRSNIVIPMQ